MLTLFRLGLCAVLLIPAYGKIFITHIGPTTGDLTVGGFGPNYTTKIPRNSVFRTALGTGERVRLYRDSFDENASGNNRRAISRLVQNPEDGKLFAAAVNARFLWSFNLPPLDDSGSRYPTADDGEGGRVIPFEFYSRETYAVPEGSVAERELHYWEVPFDATELGEATVSDLPVPRPIDPIDDVEKLLYESDPRRQLDSLSYSFGTRRILLPVNQSIQVINFGSTRYDITFAQSFGAFTNAAEREEYFETDSDPSFGRSVFDQISGRLYVGLGRLNPEVVLWRSELTTLQSGNVFPGSEAVERLKYRDTFGLIMEQGMTGGDPFLYEASLGFASDHLSHMAIDSYSGNFFAFSKNLQRIIRKPLNRPSISVRARNSFAITRGEEFTPQPIGSLAEGLLNIQVEPVAKRVYYLLESGELRSMDYDGLDDRLKLTLARRVNEFTVYNNESKPATQRIGIQGAGITLMPDLPLIPNDGGRGQQAAGISSDGRFILGSQEVGNNTVTNPRTDFKTQGVLWVPGENPQVIVRPIGDQSAFAFAISANGNRAIMNGRTDPKIWTRGFGLEDALAQDPSWLTQAFALSADGRIFGGSSNDQAALYIQSVAASPLRLLEELPGASGVSRVDALSADGSAAAGTIYEGDTLTRAFPVIWKDSPNPEYLGDLPGGEDGGIVSAMSPSGEFVAGLSIDGENFPGDYGAYVWTRRDGMLPVPRVETNDAFISVSSVNDQGVVAGSSQRKAYLYHELTGTIDLEKLLEDAYGIDTTGFSLMDTTSVSADGRTIVGTAQEDGGRSRLFRATIPDFIVAASFLNGTLDLQADDDLDGVLNLFELATGTDPFDASSVNTAPLEIMTASGTASSPEMIRLTLQKPSVAASGRIGYSVLRSSDLTDFDQNGVTVVSDTATELTVEVPRALADFFILKAEQIPGSEGQ